MGGKAQPLPAGGSVAVERRPCEPGPGGGVCGAAPRLLRAPPSSGLRTRVFFPSMYKLKSAQKRCAWTFEVCLTKPL